MKGGKRLSWPAEDDAQLRRLYPDTPTASIALTLGRTIGSVYQRADRLGLKKSAAYLASPAAGRTNGRQGIGSRYPKGHVPANKGLRRPGWGPGRMKSTQFKAGERHGVAARNYCPVGTKRVDAEGYWRIKVRESRPDETCYGFGNVSIWPLLNRHIWQQAHGEIPKGHSVVFRDGNKSNCVLENLELVSRADMMRRNTIHRLHPELKQTIRLIGSIRRQIRKREAHAE